MFVLYAYFFASLLITGLSFWYAWEVYEQFYPTMLFASTSQPFSYVRNHYLNFSAHILNKSFY